VEPLSAILKELNDRFGTDFTEDDKVFSKALEERLAGDAASLGWGGWMESTQAAARRRQLCWSAASWAFAGAGTGADSAASRRATAMRAPSTAAGGVGNVHGR
jgi:hypothetical protein